MSTLETAVKLFGMYLAYRNRQEFAKSTAKNQTASGSAPVQTPADATQNRKVDPNMLLNMAMSHMRNMTNISTRSW